MPFIKKGGGCAADEAAAVQLPRQLRKS